MATPFVWPASLPQRPSDFSESRGRLVARTPMDKGVPKSRNLGRRVNPLAVSYEMTPAQLTTLGGFCDQTLLGVRRFNWPHPLGYTCEVEFIPTSEGELYSYQFISPNLLSVSMSLGVLP